MSQQFPHVDPWARSSSPTSFKGTDSPCEPLVMESNNVLDNHFMFTRRVRYIRSGVDTLLSAAECLPSLSEDIIRNTTRDICRLPSPGNSHSPLPILHSLHSHLPPLPPIHVPVSSRIPISSLLVDSEPESTRSSASPPPKLKRPIFFDEEEYGQEVPRPPPKLPRSTSAYSVRSVFSSTSCHSSTLHYSPVAVAPYPPGLTATLTPTPRVSGVAAKVDPETDPYHPAISAHCHRAVVRPGEQRPVSPAMITISCLHALVAQKSYGSEKRFLCPPPMITVRSTDPAWSLAGAPLPFSSELAMSVVNDQGADTQVRSAVTLDPSGSGICRQLHVSNMAKSKFFRLRLDLPKRTESVLPTETAPPGLTPAFPFATFESSSIAIISKPSKKTAKARNISSCILSGSSIALFNRINSQTVRTKFLVVHEGVLCARNCAWTAFTITLAHPSPATASSTAVAITYGSEVILSDPTTGVQTEPMVIRKVEKGRLAAGALGPVSQMQKIAFQKISHQAKVTDPRYYLSSVTSAEMDTTSHPLPSPAAAPAHGAEPSFGVATTSPTQSYSPVAPQVPLEFLPSNTAGGHPAASTNPFSVGGPPPPSTPSVPTLSTEEIDDKLCWTVVGITRFDYSFMETEGPAWFPITPFPNLAGLPTYRSASHTLELRIATPPLNPDLLHTKPGHPPALRLRLGEFGLTETRLTV
ncbi:hypothetical protein BJ085DRAFT_41140, partial [Dimargaris cristalligena]